MVNREHEDEKKTSEAWFTRFGKKARFISFNIPQLSSDSGTITCPYAAACAAVCYAGQGRMTLRAPVRVRELNLSKIKNSSPLKFPKMVAEDLSGMRGVTHVRIHDSGDSFSREYYKSWIMAAELSPNITFYAYTKSIPFLEWGLMPGNFRVVQSLGGKRDSDIDVTRPHSRIFPTDKERGPSSYEDGNITDIPAVIGRIKIGLTYHGNRSLSAACAASLNVIG